MKVLLSCLVLLSAAIVACAKPAHSLTVGEGFANPVGFHQAAPTFSWKLPAGAAKQTAYRIETRAEGKNWDSGWIASEQSTFVPYGGAPFDSRERVTWRVRVQDERGRDLGWSEWASLELGLLSKTDWSAQWIRPAPEAAPDGEPVASLRRAFPVAKKITRARIYVTARGLFELHLNGRRVGRDHFANGWTSYHQRLDTLTYDVTRELRTGENQLEVQLGCGWYAGRFPFGTKTRGFFGKETELLLQLEIRYADGTTERVVSDGRWEGTFEGPILSASLYDGENFDARRIPAGWRPVIAVSDLGAAELAPKPFTPVRETQTLAPQAITQPESGRYVFDLGQNMVGWARIKVPVTAGQTVTLRFAEMLKDDGTLYTDNYRSAKSTDTYTAAQTGRIEWEPHFTFHGFRYVELSGLPADSRPQKDWVTGVVLHSDLRRVGKFESSHAKLNQLQRNITWGQRGNFVDIPTDCPQRDERLGWTGDAQVFAPTAMFNFDSHAFWKSWLRSMRDDQYADGRIPHAIPEMMPKWQGRSPGWMDAATIVPWEVYVRTGDAGILADNFPMMERLVAWYRSESVGGGLLPQSGGFGDWLQPYPNAKATAQDNMLDRKGDTPLALIGTAFYARSARILADAARVLGRADDGKRYDTEAAAVRAAFAQHYFDADGKLQNAPETQTAYVLALAFDLIPAPRRGKAASNLVRLVHEADDHLRTGFLGTPFLVGVLDQAGRTQLAGDVLFRETYPSWFYSINQGATTMWERWNSYTRDQGFGDVNMNSFNHYAYGAIGQWMYERLAGLTPDPAHAGYKHFFLRPLVIEQLASARAELDTPFGRAASGWSRRGKNIVFEFTVPPNTTATLELPGARESRQLSPGTHTFSVTAEGLLTSPGK